MTPHRAVRTIRRKRDPGASTRVQPGYPVDGLPWPFVVINHNYFSGEA